MSLSPEQRRFCEMVLRNYPQWKRDLSLVDLEREDIAESLPGGIVRPPGKRGGGQKPDPTGRKVLMLEYAERGHRGQRACVAAVDKLFSLLDRETKRIVRLRFFHGQTVREVSRKMYLCERTIAWRQSAALEMLASLLGL